MNSGCIVGKYIQQKMGYPAPAFTGLINTIYSFPAVEAAYGMEKKIGMMTIAAIIG